MSAILGSIRAPHQPLMKKSQPKIALPHLALALGAVFFFMSGVFFSNVVGPGNFNQPLLASALIPVRLHQSEYPLINPLLLCDVGNAAESTQNKDLRNKILTFINDRVQQGKAIDMSVYLQRYGGGGWVGINESTLYAPASLLKVPLMIAYYKIAEENASFLDQRVTFRGSDRNGNEYFKSSQVITPGTSYTIEDLIRHMIGSSDNTATALLESAMASTTREDTYSDLGIPIPPTDPSAEYLSVKQYAYFFRLLYNATYLTREYSERALQHLTDVDFVQGIRAGVPPGVTIAQKFGERTVINQDGTINRRELHDCGIVYKKNSNYLLCVMSRGNDFNQMARNISDLSSLVYNAVSLPPSPTPY